MRAPALAIVLLLAAPAQAYAWGFAGHRLIMDRAVALLPAPLRPFFDRHRAAVVERSIDPDLWRTAGFGEENKHHFLDMDAPGHGPPPFAGLPRAYEAAVAKFGAAHFEQYGALPWRAAAFQDRLRRAFVAAARRGAAGQVDVILFSAALGHYVADAHVPFHATVNHDGQLTGQRGMHARFETQLFERYRDEYRIRPSSLPPVGDIVDFLFARLSESAGLAPVVLAADRAAGGGGTSYDDRYYAALFREAGPVLERRLNESIAAVAAAIAGAWESAGRPAVPAG